MSGIYRKQVWGSSLLILHWVLLLVSCEQTELKEILEDRYVPQKLDTVAVYDNWFLVDGQTFAPTVSESKDRFLNLYLDGQELYVANKGAKRIDVFDVGTLSYLRSLKKDERTEAHDVYVSGDQVFVATGEMSKIQVFDKVSGEYITRIGTGSYTGNVSKNGCVAATDDYVFVRDSKQQDIRVFLRQSLSAGKVNNEVFARLDTKGYFINSGNEPLHNPYDMMVLGDSLYAFLYCSGSVHAYALADIKKDQTVYPVKTQLDAGGKIYSAAVDGQRGTVWLSMTQGGEKKLAEFTVDHFHSRNFSRPLRMFSHSDRHPFPAYPMIAIHEGHLIYPQNNKVEKWRIINQPTYIINPLP